MKKEWKETIQELKEKKEMFIYIGIILLGALISSLITLRII